MLTHPQAPPGPDDHRDKARRLRWLIGLLVALLALAIAWQFTPARAWLEPMRLVQDFRALAQQLGWLAVLGVFVLACCLAVPLSLLTLLAVLAFDALHGVALVLVGACLCALITFGVGRWLGQAAVAQWAGPKLQALNAMARRRGLLAVIVVRLVPAAPFAVVNMMLGASRIRWRDLVVGNTLGMLPMVGFTAWAAPQILAQLQHPTRMGWVVALGIVAVVAAISWLIKRWVRNL